MSVSWDLILGVTPSLRPLEAVQGKQFRPSLEHSSMRFFCLLSSIIVKRPDQVYNLLRQGQVNSKTHKKYTTDRVKLAEQQTGKMEKHHLSGKS